MKSRAERASRRGPCSQGGVSLDVRPRPCDTERHTHRGSGWNWSLPCFSFSASSSSTWGGIGGGSHPRDSALGTVSSCSDAESAFHPSTTPLGDPRHESRPVSPILRQLWATPFGERHAGG